MTGSEEETSRMRLARAMENAIIPRVTAGSLQLARTTHLVGPRLT
jgi:hypothetical protein